MKLSSTALGNGKPVPEEFALCAFDASSHVRMSANRSPHLRWDDLPEGTRSLAIVCTDPDAPPREEANHEDRTIPYDFQRDDFFHWVLVDVPVTLQEIPAAADSNGVTPHGKPLGKTQYGVRGRNSYTDWFEGDASMEGDYGGYDGPCPPWNDERVHRYEFTVYALDVSSMGLEGAFGGPEALDAIEGHVLAQATLTTTYALNPEAR